MSRTNNNPSQPAHTPRRMLLIDDDPNFAKIIQQAAKNIGIQLDWVSSMNQIDEKHVLASHEAILLDYDIGEATGYEVLEKFRGLNKLPVVMISMTDRPKENFGSGVAIAGFVSKWMDYEEFFAKVLGILNPNSENIGEAYGSFDLLNLPHLERLNGLTEAGQEPFVHTLTDMYLHSFPEAFHNLRTSIADGNVENIVRHAHRIKGMSRNIGADRVAEILGDLEASPELSSEDFVKMIERAYQDTESAIAAARSHVFGSGAAS